MSESNPLWKMLYMIYNRSYQTQALPWTKKNDAETVVVAKGCVLAAFDHADENIANRGRRAVFDATGRNDNLVKNLNGNEELEEQISSVECRLEERNMTDIGNTWKIIWNGFKCCEMIALAGAIC